MFERLPVGLVFFLVDDVGWVLLKIKISSQYEVIVIWREFLPNPMAEHCGLGLRVARDPATRLVIIDGLASGGPADRSGGMTLPPRVRAVIHF